MNSLSLEPPTTRRRYCAQCGRRGVRRIMLIGDSNMRKRYIALTRVLGEFVDECEVTSEFQAPAPEHRHTLDVQGVGVGYGWWVPPWMFTPSGVATGLPLVWPNMSVADYGRTVILADYGLWSPTTPQPGDQTEYCAVLRGWRDQVFGQGVVRPLQLWWLTTTPIDLGRGAHNPKLQARWANHSIDFPAMDACALSLGFQILNGSHNFAGPSDINPDGYHITPRYADTQADLIIDTMCPPLSLGEAE